METEGVRVDYAEKLSDTPLSDLIAAYIASRSRKTWGQFLDAFQVAELGVHVVGVPSGTVGKFVTQAGQSVSLGLTRHAGGRPTALAFADPEAFARRFGRPFNAGMSGTALLATLLADPECAGVLVNSALSEVSVVIDRSTAEELMRPSGPKPWWRLW